MFSALKIHSDGLFSAAFGGKMYKNTAEKLLTKGHFTLLFVCKVKMKSHKKTF